MKQIIPIITAIVLVVGLIIGYVAMVEVKENSAIGLIFYMIYVTLTVYLIGIQVFLSRVVAIPREETLMGSFIVNTTDPDEEFYKLELEVDTPYLVNKKVILLSVQHR